MAIQSTKGSNIEATMINILNRIQLSQPFKRYCVYSTNSPLDAQALDSNNIVKQQPDITDDLMNLDVIYLTPYDYNIVTDAKVRIFFNSIEGFYDDTKSIVVDDTYLMEVIIPIPIWVLKNQGKIRPIRIFCEIAKQIDNQTLTGIGIGGGFGRTIITRRRFVPVDKNYSSMQIYIKVSDFSRTTVNN